MIFFSKESKSKKTIFWGGVEGAGGQINGQTNRPKSICPFNSFEFRGIMHKCTSYVPFLFYFLGEGRGGGMRAEIIEFFFHKESKSKKILLGWEWGNGAGLGGVLDGWTDE